MRWKKAVSRLARAEPATRTTGGDHSRGISFSDTELMQ